MSTTELQLKALFDFLTTPFGILAVSLFILLLTLSFMLRHTKWAMLSLMFFASTLSFTSIDPANRHLIFPLEQIKQQGRGTTMAFMVLVLAGLLMAPRGWRQRYFIGGTVAFFLFELFMCGRVMLTGDFGRGAVSVIIFLLMFITLAAALPHALQQWGDAVTLVRAIAAYGVVFVIANVAQFVVNPAVVEQNSRFFGTTGNPQHAGAVLACVLLPMAYLMTRPGRSKATRLFMSAILSATVIFLLWTGSRTALLMAVVGLGLLFRARLGRLAIGGVVVGGLVLLGLNVLLPDRDVVSERLVSTLDTRSVVWQRLTDDFLRNPLFGTISGELGISENSYLSILARFGLVGALPFIVAAILITRSMFKLQRVRRRLDDTMLADLTTAGLVQLAVGAIFEGFLAGTLSPQVLVMYCYLALLAFLLEAAEAAPVAVDSGYDEIPDEFRDHVYGEGETVPASTW